MRRITATIVAFALLILAGCASGSRPETGTQGLQQGAAEQKAVIAIVSEPNTFDPHKSFSGYVFTVTNQIYESLTDRATDGSLKPRLATEWKALDDVTWELKLRPDVKFQDGTPLTAEAVKFSLERLQDPETKAPGAFILGMIADIKVIDETTLQIMTDKPFAPLPAHLSHPVTAIVSPEGAKNDLGAEPVGTGPFVLKDWQPGDAVTLAANPDYWGGKPTLDTVVLRVIPEIGTQFVELKAGTIDLVTTIQPEKYDELVNDPDLTATKFLGWGNLFLGFNTAEGPLATPQVRQAIAHALDRQSMVTTLRQGMAESATSFLPPTVFGAASDLAPIPYDTTLAKSLLAQAGVTTPLKLTLNTYEGAETKQIAGAIQAQLADIGIDLEVIVTDYAAYDEATSQPNHGIFLSSWGTVTMDADYTFYSLLHSSQHEADNRAFYANPAVDALLETARGTADEAARLRAYREIEEHLQKDLPYMTVYYPLSGYAKNQRLQGEVYPFSFINLDLRKASIK